MGWSGEDESLNCPLAHSLAHFRAVVYRVVREGLGHPERWCKGWWPGGSLAQLSARSLARSLTRCTLVVYGVVGGGWISQMV